MSKEALQEAKKLLDDELAQAQAEIIKRWKKLMTKTGLGKVTKALKNG